MLTLERIRREFAALPALSRFGVATLAFALLVDLMAHLEATEGTLDGHVHTGTAYAAHLGVFVGMVLIIAGVIGDAVRAARLRHAVKPQRKGVA
jgi:hypothetical protein